LVDIRHKISSKVPWMVSEETVRLMSLLNAGESDEARFIGGCVRDALVNRKSFDIDIAVNFSPNRTIEILKDNNIRYVPTGLQHGTVTAILNGSAYEVTSLREDVETDGRHAKVKFTTDWEKDASRRDFTINAISVNMQGEVFDYFGGIEDLRLGKVRFIGDAEKRIEEDYLRILRFFRFYGIFAKGDVDRDVFLAIENNVKGLDLISKERICIEMLKILSIAKPASIVDLMNRAKVLNHVLPNHNNYDIDSLYRLERFEEVFNNQESPIRRIAILIDNYNDIDNCLHLSNYQKNNLKILLDISKKISPSIEEIELQKLIYKHGNEAVRSALLIAAAKENDIMNLNDLYDKATSFYVTRFPITGDDVKECGIEEGNSVGYILKELEDWWIENGFSPKRTECLEKLKEISSKY